VTRASRTDGRRSLGLGLDIIDRELTALDAMMT
jgi:hypothetical protein